MRRHLQRAEHVVAHRLPGVVHLHQRHMLVGRGVEHELRRPGREDLLQARGVLHVGRQRHDLEAGFVLADPLLDAVQRELARLHQHQPRGLEARELAAQLAADRTACAGDQHGLAGHHVIDVRGVDPYRFAAEQILDVHRPHGVDRHLAAHQVTQTGHREHVGARADRHVGRTLLRLGRCRGHGQDHVIGPVALEHLRQDVDAAHDRMPEQLEAPFLPVVIDQRHHLPVGAAFELAHQHRASRACAHHHHRLARTDQRPIQAVLLPHPPRCPPAAHRHQQQHRVQHDHRARQQGWVAIEGDQRDQCERRQRDRLCHPLQVGQARKDPHPPIKARHPAGDGVHPQQGRADQQHLAVVVRGPFEVEAQQQAAGQGHRSGQQVEQIHERGAGVPSDHDVRSTELRVEPGLQPLCPSRSARCSESKPRCSSRAACAHPSPQAIGAWTCRSH